MEENEYHPQKYKRRMTKTKDLRRIGHSPIGKIHYPKSTKSLKTKCSDSIMRGFQINTSYHSNLTSQKETIMIRVYIFYDIDTLAEFIIVECSDLTLFLHHDDFTLEHPYEAKTNTKLKIVKQPRRLLMPQRETLDNYNLSISMFQRDEYLAIPICLSDRNKHDISEGWLYLYNTVVNEVEGLYIEAVSDTPIICRGNIQMV